MSLTYSQKELSEEEMAEFTPEKCWAAVDRCAELLSEPGYMQAELKVDPEFGPVFDKAAKELLHLLIEEYDVGKSPSEQSVVERMGELLITIDKTQSMHLLSEIAKAGAAMQMIPFNEILTSIEGDDLTVITDKLTAEQKADVEAEKAKADADGTSMVAAKLNPRIVPIFAAGVQAAGGHAEFARIQMGCAKDLPPEFQTNPSLVIATQMTGAVMKAILFRATSAKYVNMQTRTIIESAISLKQALHMSNVAAWSFSPEELLDYLQLSMKSATLRALSDLEEEKAEAVAPAESAEVSKSTVFEGNGTVN